MNASRNHAAPPQALLEQLIVAVSQLARPAESQIAHLRSLGMAASVDELALDLDAVAGAALRAPGLLSEAQQALLHELDRRLDDMSGAEHSDLWSHQALRTSPAWTHVRELARSTLSELHAERSAAR